MELQAEFPGASLKVIHAFQQLLSATYDYHLLTGRHLQIWGELGELYAEIKLGVKRHAAFHQGSDGLLDGMDVEIKTLSPARQTDEVVVKAAGSFRKLVIVKISDAYDFSTVVVDREHLRGRSGKFLKTRWRDHRGSHAKQHDDRNSRLLLAASIRFGEEE